MEPDQNRNLASTRIFRPHPRVGGPFRWSHRGRRLALLRQIFLSIGEGIAPLRGMPSAVTRREPYEQEFDRWIEPILEAFQHKVRRKWAPLYLRGLLAPGDRKSVEPMAGRVAPDDVAQLHHFVAASPWDCGPIEDVLAAKANLAGDAFSGSNVSTAAFTSASVSERNSSAGSTGANGGFSWDMASLSGA
jgi:hypothetical protein